MNDESAQRPSQTDWERVDAMKDDDIDYSDSPKLTLEQLSRAVLVEPRVKHGASVTVHVDPKVAAWYQKHGGDMQRRLRAALEIYATAHES